MRTERAVAVQPRGAPAEAGDAEALEPLGEGPQLLQREGPVGAGNELLAHGAKPTILSAVRRSRPRLRRPAPRSRRRAPRSPGSSGTSTSCAAARRPAARSG